MSQMQPNIGNSVVQGGAVQGSDVSDKPSSDMLAGSDATLAVKKSGLLAGEFLLRDPDVVQRRHYASALARSNESLLELLPSVTSAVLSESDRKVQQDLLTVLEKSGSEAVSVLSYLLRDERAGIAVDAARALGAMGAKGELGVLPLFLVHIDFKRKFSNRESPLVLSYFEANSQGALAFRKAIEAYQYIKNCGQDRRLHDIDRMRTSSGMGIKDPQLARFLVGMHCFPDFRDKSLDALKHVAGRLTRDQKNMVLPVLTFELENPYLQRQSQQQLITSCTEQVALGAKAVAVFLARVPDGEWGEDAKFKRAVSAALIGREATPESVVEDILGCLWSRGETNSSLRKNAIGGARLLLSQGEPEVSEKVIGELAAVAGDGDPRPMEEKVGAIRTLRHAKHHLDLVLDFLTTYIGDEEKREELRVAACTEAGAMLHLDDKNRTRATELLRFAGLYEGGDPNKAVRKAAVLALQSLQERMILIETE